MKSIKAPNYTWLYMDEQELDSVEYLQKLFHLHPVVLGELNSPTYRPKVSRYKDYTFMVVHFPIFNEEENRMEVGEVDILINDKYIATSCDRRNNALYQYFQEQSKNQNNPTRKLPSNQYLLLFKILDLMLNACFPELDRMADDLDQIECQIFGDGGKGMVRKISVIKRNILNMRRTIKPQYSILESLENKKLFKEDIDYRTRANDVLGTHIRVWNVLENQKETIDSLEATNDSLSTYRLNKIMKILTIFSVTLLPAGIIAGLFGMNVIAPLHSFWSILGLIFFLMGVTLTAIKFKKWM